MPFQVSPGIVVTERDLTTVVPNVATSIGAIAINSQWGPVLERTTITTENDLIDTFGKPNGATFADIMCASNYLAYSNNLVVVRNVSAAATNAVVGDVDSGTALDVLNDDDYAGKSFTDQLFVGKWPGDIGNSLKAYAIDKHGWDATGLGVTAAAIQTLFKSNFDRAPGTSKYASDRGGSLDEMHIIVCDEDGLFTGVNNEILERFESVSKATDAKRVDGSSNYVETVLRNESKYIWLGAVGQLTASTADSNTHAGAGTAGSTFNQMNSNTELQKFPGGSLTGGVASAALSAGEYQAAFDKVANPEVVDVTILMAGGSAAIASANARSVAQHIVTNIAEVRKDCVACVSPHIDSVVRTTGETAKIVADKTAIASSSYGIMDSAWKYQYDRYNDVFRYVPMNGDIGGLCARTDFTNDPWWSPAGYTRGTIKNIVKLSWEPTKADRDTLYQSSINPLVTQTGAGVLLFGDKTMQLLPSAFDRINVRRLFIILEKAISIAAKALLFEFNDEFTRAQFVNIVSPFLREVQGRRGITDFKVVCDSSNNTGQVIDTNNFVGDIYIKPARSINYIQLNFIAARTDVSFSEIGG
tara:strand:- start:6120 stop:7877 length:1758 start_codon:yes stop_codon:yes gene_type:complete